jgi:hypothetical protein
MTPLEPSVPYGFCHCGCGRKTDISPRTRGRRGNRKGEPLFFVNGHNATRRPTPEAAAPFKIEGVYCRLIELTQRQYAIVWESDYLWLMEHRWQAKKHAGGFYACRSTRSKGKCRYISMHREIIGLKDGSVLTGDHYDPWNTLDNRRANIRPATRAQNQSNRRIGKNNKTGCKGIYPSGSRWRVRMYANGESIELGTVDSKAEAIEVYHAGILKHHGKFARLR